MHSNINFSVTHLVISEVDGSFKVYDGKIVSTTADFNNASIEFSVDVNSINTDNSMRDDHLKGDDFFNAATYPKMTFKSTSFTKVSGNKYNLTGDLQYVTLLKKRLSTLFMVERQKTVMATQKLDLKQLVASIVLIMD
jgi:polyisoprenoid-binding protein YceI